MKKFIAVIITVCMIMSLVACDAKEEATNEPIAEFVDNRLLVKPQKLVPYEDVQLYQEGDSSALSVQGELYKIFQNAVAEYDAAYLTIDFNDIDGQLYYQLEQHYYDKESTQSFWYEFVNYTDDEITDGTFFEGGYSFPIEKSVHKPEKLTTVVVDIGIYDKGFLFTEKLVLWYQNGVLMIEEGKGIPKLCDLTQTEITQEGENEQTQEAENEQTSDSPLSQDDTNNSDISVSSTSFPFIDYIYKEDLSGREISFKEPDESGEPTIIVLDGVSYELQEWSSVCYDESSNSRTANGTAVNGDTNISIMGSINIVDCDLWRSDDDTRYRYTNTDSVVVENALEEMNKCTFIGITFKHDSLNFTFQFKTPDESGNPTEILVNGETYSDLVFDNETLPLSDYTMNRGTVSATTKYNDLEISLDFQGGEGGWRVYGPGMWSGDYVPE